MPYLYQSYVEGTFARKVRALHAEYGNVVRVAPNRLAVDGVVGWKDVHAVRAPSPEMPKLPGYYGPDSHRSLVASPTREGHQRHRRALAYGFSNTAMHEQEPVITYYVDMLIRQLSKRSKEGPLDMAMWFNFLSFDVVGDLAFADSFNILKKGKYHPWTSNLIKGIEGATLNRFFLFSSPLLAPLALLDLNGTIKTFWENRRIADSKTKARIDLGPDPPVQTDLIGRDGKPVVRKDFVGYMLRFNQKASNEALSEVEMKRNANIIMNAGSETTATALAVLTFMFSLPENRIWMERATEEVRATFKSEDEINLHSVSNHPLPILRACSEEALRFHPPAPDMPPRLCPGGTVGDYYVPKGVSFFFSLPCHAMPCPGIDNPSINTCFLYLRRPLSKYPNSPHTTTPTTSWNATTSGRSGSYLQTTHCTRSDSPTTTFQCSSPLATATETAWARTWPTSRCDSSCAGSSSASTTSAWTTRAAPPTSG